MNRTDVPSMFVVPEYADDEYFELIKWLTAVTHSHEPLPIFHPQFWGDCGQRNARSITVTQEERS